MEVTGTNFGIHDPDNVILYPAPNFIHPPERIREHVGEVRTPPSSRGYRCEETEIPISRFTSGYSREYQQRMSRGGFSQDPQVSTENYVSSTGGATSPRNFSLSSGSISCCFFCPFIHSLVPIQEKQQRRAAKDSNAFGFNCPFSLLYQQKDNYWFVCLFLICFGNASQWC